MQNITNQAKEKAQNITQQTLRKINIYFEKKDIDITVSKIDNDHILINGIFNVKYKYSLQGEIQFNFWDCDWSIAL